MDQWILETMSRYGYLGLALLIMAENLFPPIPSEIILTFGGFMTTYTQMHIPGAVLSATVGSSLINRLPIYVLRPQKLVLLCVFFSVPTNGYP